MKGTLYWYRLYRLHGNSRVDAMAKAILTARGQGPQRLYPPKGPKAIRKWRHPRRHQVTNNPEIRPPTVPAAGCGQSGDL